MWRQWRERTRAFTTRWWLVGLGATGVVLAALAGAGVLPLPFGHGAGAGTGGHASAKGKASAEAGTGADGTAKSDAQVPIHVHLTKAKAEAAAIGLTKTRRSPLFQEVDVPGVIEPEHDKFVEIRARVQASVRAVNVQIGQIVKKGEVLAILESSEIGAARLDLATRLNALEVARNESDWKATVAANVGQLVADMRKTFGLQELETRYKDKPLGSLRAQLLSSYGDLQIAQVEEAKLRDLAKEQVVSEAKVLLATRDRVTREAAIHSILEQAGYDAARQKLLADQAVQVAEAAVSDARKRLEWFGLDPELPPALMRSRTNVKSNPANPDASVVKTSHPAAGAASGGGAGVPTRIAANPVPAPVNVPTSGSAAGVPPSQVGKPTVDQDWNVYEIRAPFDGIILDRHAAPGQNVGPQDVLFPLADLSQVHVVAHVPESDIGLLPQLNAQLDFTAASYPGIKFSAHVHAIGADVDPKTRTVLVLADSDNANKLLRIGMFVRIRLARPTPAPVLWVPAKAVVEVNGHEGVFLPAPDPSKTPEKADGEPTQAFIFQTVETGALCGDRRIILRGLDEGREVVADGAFTLKSELILQSEPEEE